MFKRLSEGFLEVLGGPIDFYKAYRDRGFLEGS